MFLRPVNIHCIVLLRLLRDVLMLARGLYLIINLLIG